MQVRIDAIKHLLKVLNVYQQGIGAAGAALTWESSLPGHGACNLVLGGRWWLLVDLPKLQ